MLSERKILITGAAGGIGLTVAKAMCRFGADVILNDIISETDAKSIVEELDTMGPGEVIYVRADLSQLPEIENIFSFINDKWHKLDVLVNNAGTQHVNPIENFSVEKWDQVIATNLTACFHLIRLFLPLMHNWGRIINIASVHGLVASMNKCAYVAAKHGLVGLTKVVALETAKTNVTCNAICPGFVLTPLIEKQVEIIAKQENIDLVSAAKKLVGEKHPSEQFVLPENIADLCIFLCSDAAKEMRGSIIPMDGGWTAV